MKFILVAAMAKNRVIGKNNGLPWDLPQEMADFRAFTQGKTILMGRKTYEGLGRILPKRRNIMLTREPSAVKIGEFPTVQTENGWKVDGGEKGEIEIYTSVEEVQKNLKEDEDLLVLGGSEVYKLFLENPLSEIRLSEIHGDYEGDTYFPAFEELYEEFSRKSKEGYDLVWYKRKLA
ncbi:dihydrofolate reductase [Candidatus Gracilibacteria bacterium]|nr:dihydrofolate reductase [Candidatus Gracilibacteria bacterium]